MKNIIKKMLRESLMSESFDGGYLFGYHVTSADNLDVIKSQGLKVGHRGMQGKGLYGFYDIEHAKRYARKGEIKNPILIKFVVTNTSRFLYLNMDIAKDVLGNDYHLMTQIENYFYDGYKGFFALVKETNPDMSDEKLRSILSDIENNNSEMKQRTFVFSLIPSYVNDRLNIVWNGNYGLEFRINNINLVDIVGYMGLDSEFTSVAIEDKIPDDPKYAELVEFLKDNPKLDDFGKARNFIEQRWFEVRNNRDFEYYNRLIDLIDDLK
jgi:hypothetical protein